MLGTLADTISTIWNLFLRNDPTKHIQKDLDLLPIVFCSVLDQFRLVENSDISHFLTLSHLLQYFFQNYPIYGTIQSIWKYNTILSTYLSSLVPFYGFFDFQISRNGSPIIPIFDFSNLTVYTIQEMDEYLGTLVSSDPDFFPLQQPANLPETQSTTNSPTNLVKTLYPNRRNILDTPP